MGHFAVLEVHTTCAVGGHLPALETHDAWSRGRTKSRLDFWGLFERQKSLGLKVFQTEKCEITVTVIC